MSRVIGEELPPALYTHLNGSDLEQQIGPTLFLISVDDAGFPNLALLSYGEVLAVSTRELRVIIWRSGHTTRYLRERPGACLALVEPERVLYIKASARFLGPAVEGATPLDGFALDVVQVLEDAEAGTELTSSATYSYIDRTAEQLVAGWRRQHTILAAL